MATDFDAIVVGAGHNGLTAATVLAKKGLSVLCVEKNNWPEAWQPPRSSDINMLRYVCQFVEPRYAMTMLNYPGQSKIKVDLLKIPQSFERTPGEPVCIWRFAFED